MWTVIAFHLHSLDSLVEVIKADTALEAADDFLIKHRVRGERVSVVAVIKGEHVDALCPVAAV